MRLGLLRGTALLMAVALAGSGCAGRWAYRQGKSEARNGNWDLAVARLTRALQYDPDNIDYKLALENAKIQASRAHHHDAEKHLAANELAPALDELDIASKFDPGNQAFALERDIVRDKIRRTEEEQQQRAKFEEMKRRADASRAPVTTLSPRSPIPISLHMPDASLQKVFDTLAQLAGVNILYDDAFRDKQVTVNLSDVTFQEALDQLTFVNNYFYKVLDTNTLIIAPEQPQKRRHYEENLMRTFYLQNTEVNDMQNNIRQLLQGGQPPRMAINQNLRAITVMGNADEIALVAKLIEAQDKPLGEVLVEIQILDVKRTLMKQYGVELANAETGSILFDPNGTGTATTTNLRAHLLSSLNLADFVVNIPNRILTKFLQTESTARILAAPRLRGAEGKQTSLRIGTEVPIPVTTFTAQNTGAGGNNSFAPATSFQYRNVGVNMELTPRVNSEGEITFDPLAAEFSLIGGDRDVGGGLKVPEFLTRNVRGTLRIKDGETALIGGLLQGEDTDTLTGIAGLSSVPILKNLLSSHKPGKSDSEIMISITPHIVRGPKLSDIDLKSSYAGTRELIKVPGSRPPLFGEIEEPTPTPAPAEAPAPTTPPLGVAPPPPPVPAGSTPGPAPEAALAPAPPMPPDASAPAGEPIAVIFSPPELPIKVGETQDLSVIVLHMNDLVSVDVALSYDSTALEAKDAKPGALLTLDGAAVSAEKNLEPGRVRARFARPAPQSGPGTGAIAVISFGALKPGPSTVTIESLSLITPRGRERITLPGPGRVVVLP
jgi:general secretion pathway protein D